MIKVAGEIPSDIGDDERENTNGEAGGALEYRDQEGRGGEATHKRTAISTADHPNQPSNHAAPWMKTVAHQK